MTWILSLLAAIPGLGSAIGNGIGLIMGYFVKRKQQQDDADHAQSDAEEQHAHDGAQSVEDRESSLAQDAALDKLKEQLENPTPVVVTDGGKK